MRIGLVLECQLRAVNQDEIVSGVECGRRWRLRLAVEDMDSVLVCMLGSAGWVLSGDLSLSNEFCECLIGQSR